MNQYSIAICRFPGGGVERHEVGSWLLRTGYKWKTDPRISRIFTPGPYVDTPITMLRNLAVKECLAAGIDYILMIDSDIEPDYREGREPDAAPFWDTAWDFMMERRAAEEDFIGRAHADFPGMAAESLQHEVMENFSPVTICAPYCGPPPVELCYVFHWQSFESGTPDPMMKLNMIEREDAARRRGIERVAAIPTGLILYDARAFKILAKNKALPWFDYEWSDEYETEKASTEDVYQTRNADFLGLPQFVAWSCWARHWKTKGVERPIYITSDIVHESFRQAVRRDYKTNQKLTFVRRSQMVDSDFPIVSNITRMEDLTSGPTESPASPEVKYVDLSRPIAGFYQESDPDAPVGRLVKTEFRDEVVGLEESPASPAVPSS